jgi:hypothetical protein
MNDAPARLLVVHADDDFLSLIEEIGTATDAHRLPPTDRSPVDAEHLMEANSRHGATVIGPSLDEDEARSLRVAATERDDG